MMFKSSWILLFFVCCLWMSCRDTKALCNEISDKYVQCIQSALQKAKQDKRSNKHPELLQQLKAQMSPQKLRKRYVSKCLQSPPNAYQVSCLKKATCGNLSTCLGKKK